MFCSSIVNQLCICGAGVADTSAIATRSLHFSGTLVSLCSVALPGGLLFGTVISLSIRISNMDKQTDKETDRQTDRQAGRQTNREIYL